MMNAKPKSLIVIPARLASTRLPGKLLLNETGKPLIQHTFESALGSQLAEQVVVAADDPKIVAEVERFGGQVRLTRVDHVCGTDRVAEIAQHFPEYDLIVNMQGDEPELPGTAIDLALSIFEKHPEAQMATLATPIRDRKLLDSPNCVKVVMDCRQRAMYFSRAAIPFARNGDERWLVGEEPGFFQHIGLYVYRRDFLLNLSQIPIAPMETIESLEQLRVLFSGIPIHVEIIEHSVTGIDTAEDYAAFVRRNKSR